jgi:imidazolonepropionase-like amidohydrolase
MKNPKALMSLFALSFALSQSFFLISAWSQDAAHPAPFVVVVKAGRVLDVRSGKYLDHQMILIEGDRIKEIGAESQVQSRVPPDAKVIDLSRSTVLPGLIDSHTHLTFSPGQTGYRGLSISVPRGTPA